MHDFIGRANYLVLEANHSVEMLQQGHYPQYLKERILGDNGHLSTRLWRGLSQWVLHRSFITSGSVISARRTTIPELARKTVERIPRSKGIIAGKDFQRSLRAKTPSEIYKLV